MSLIRKLTLTERHGRKCLEVELQPTDAFDRIEAKLALGALMPGVRVDQVGKASLRVDEYWYKGAQDWPGLSAEALNDRLRAAFPSFVKSVSRPKRREVKLTLGYKGFMADHSALLRDYLMRLDGVNGVVVNGQEVTLSVGLLLDFRSFEPLLRQYMRFSL